MSAIQPVALAKLSMPRLYGVRSRKRLFDELDAQRRHPLVWVSGPPGAGKTTLVASYMQTRKLPCLWYQVDSGDSDPVSFFFYLAQGVPQAVQAESKRAGSKRTVSKRPVPKSPAAHHEPLQLLSPGYLADLPAFTRRFFRALFQRMPPESVLVLDNFQDAAPASGPVMLYDIARDALSEVRAGISLIVVSRTDPPAPFARALANGQIGSVGWDELRLTPEETRDIATSERELDPATLQLLQQQSGGWPAGLVLMLQSLKQTGAMHAALPIETRESVFAYFAGQVLEQVPAQTRELLLRTAFLSRVSVHAAQTLTGNMNAGLLLDELHRQRLFTDRRVDLGRYTVKGSDKDGGKGDDSADHPSDHTSADIGYQYHALFREFLQSRIEASLSPEERAQLRTRSAELLEADGATADALHLHAANADWHAATALILKRARGLIAEGRWLTLKAWVALLPKEHVAQAPWLMLWVGSSLILVDPPRARTLLMRAYDGFRAAGDELGQALVATGAIESYNIEFSDFSALDPWIEVLERLLQKGVAFPTPATRLRVYVAMMLATMLRQPAHPMLPDCLEQVVSMSVQDNIPLFAKADTATQLLQFFDFTGDLQGAIALVARVEGMFEREDLSPFRRAGWLVFFSYHCALVGTPHEGFDALDRLRAIAHDFGMKWFGFFDIFFRTLMHLLGPTPLAAAPLMQQLAAAVKPGRPAEAAQYHLARVLMYQATGEASLAVYHGEMCLEASSLSGGALFGVLFPTVIASAFVEAGRPQRALELVAQARAVGQGTAYRHLEALMLMVQAYAHSRDGREQTDAAVMHALLARALARGRDERTAYFFRWLVVGFRRMLAIALEADIEADCARGLIDQFKVVAESPDVERWPWAIRIYALGRFALVIGGVPHQAQRKVQKKPLEMLKYLVAHGGREVGVLALETALWPDAEGGAAAEAFEVTLRRLRKLLGNDEAIALKDGKLALNPGVCWVDVWAFERAQGHAEALIGHGGAPADPACGDVFDALAERVAKLYPGPFLAGDEEHPWLLGCRQRLASKFTRFNAAAGQHWQDNGHADKAERAYQRAIEIDPLAETLYARLMGLQAHEGRRAEALETYRRCRHMLSVVLGVQPSAQTEAQMRALLERSVDSP